MSTSRAARGVLIAPRSSLIVSRRAAGPPNAPDGSPHIDARLRAGSVASPSPAAAPPWRPARIAPVAGDVALAEGV